MDNMDVCLCTSDHPITTAPPVMSPPTMTGSPSVVVWLLNICSNLKYPDTFTMTLLTHKVQSVSNVSRCQQTQIFLCNLNLQTFNFTLTSASELWGYIPSPTTNVDDWSLTISSYVSDTHDYNFLPSQILLSLYTLVLDLLSLLPILQATRVIALFFSSYL